MYRMEIRKWQKTGNSKDWPHVDTIVAETRDACFVEADKRGYNTKEYWWSEPKES